MSESKFNLTIGADPEFFVLEGEGKNEKPLMACGKFGGGKGAPILLSDEGGFLEDGTTIEFNMATCKTIWDAKDRVFRLVAEFEKQKKVKVSYHSSIKWSMAELKKHPEAMAIGCAPDRYAYGLRTAPSIAAFKDRRFAGGHIHIGIDPWPEGLNKVNVVRYLDVMAYAPYVSYFGDSHRFPHYGYPGLYRETSYGLEWRSPDNSWCNPAWWSGASREHTAGMLGFLGQFQKAVDLLHQVLEKDGHGSRFDMTVQEFILQYNLAEQFSAPASKRKVVLPSQCRASYMNMETLVRTLLPQQKAPKKKMYKASDILNHVVDSIEV